MKSIHILSCLVCFLLSPSLYGADVLYCSADLANTDHNDYYTKSQPLLINGIEIPETMIDQDAVEEIETILNQLNEIVPISRTADS